MAFVISFLQGCVVYIVGLPAVIVFSLFDGLIVGFEQPFYVNVSDFIGIERVFG